MARVTIVEPTEHDAVRASAPSNHPNAEVIKDKNGRSITVREPNILQESQLVRLLGDAALNAAYMTAYAMPAVMAIEIDGDAIHFPANQLQLDALMQRLGREGMAAVMAHIIAKSEASADAATGDAATIKKLL